MNTMLRHIEPFMIYQNDITKSHITDPCIIEMNIYYFKKMFMMNQERISKIVRKYSSGAEEDFPYLLMLLGQELYDSFNDVYKFNVPTLRGYSNSSLLNYINKVDYSNYYNTLIAKGTLSLMIPAGAEQIKKLEEFYISRTEGVKPEKNVDGSTDAPVDGDEPQEKSG